MSKIKPAGLYLSLSGLLKDLIADGFLRQADANRLAAAQGGRMKLFCTHCKLLPRDSTATPRLTTP
jgi:hypothetical protein